MADFFYFKAREEIATDVVDLVNDTIKVILVTSAYSPSATDLVVQAGGSDAATAEINVSGYVRGFGGAGRKTLANKSLTSSGGTVVPKFDADDVVWVTLATGTTIAAAIIIKEGAVNDTTSRLIAYFGLTPTPTNGGDITLRWNAAGLLTF